MSDIFQEVQEEYRREQLSQLWTKYRIPVLAAAGGIVFIVAAYQGWVYWHAKMLEASSRQFDAAVALMESGRGQEKVAGAAFAKLAHDGSGAYAFVAKLQEAAVRTSAGDYKGAIVLYDHLAQEGEGGALFADYARLRAALLLVDVAPLAEIQKRLDTVAGGDSPWRIPAEELLGYAHWRAGGKAEALRLYDLVKNNPEAPAGTKRRATELSALIAGGMTVADLKAAPAVSLATPAEPLALPPIFDPLAPGQATDPATPPTSPTNAPTP